MAFERETNVIVEELKEGIVMFLFFGELINFHYLNCSILIFIALEMCVLKLLFEYLLKCSWKNSWFEKIVEICEKSIIFSKTSFETSTDYFNFKKKIEKTKHFQFDWWNSLQKKQNKLLIQKTLFS